jgi:uncharacterized protein
MNCLTRITRHPIKGHGREDLASVSLSPGACLPWDRHWAVAHEAAKLVPGWNKCANFARGAKAPQLMAVTAVLDEARAEVTLAHPIQGTIRFRPDDPQDLPRFLDWVAPLIPAERAAPTKIVSADVGMTDSPFPSVAILSDSSLADLSRHLGQPLSHDRWRGNLWIKGANPFAEFDWIGRHIRIGQSVLQIKERITRCVATMVNPTTGERDADTLGVLESTYGHQDFGVYAVVVEGGPVALGDPWRLM